MVAECNMTALRQAVFRATCEPGGDGMARYRETGRLISNFNGDVHRCNNFILELLRWTLDLLSIPYVVVMLYLLVGRAAMMGLFMMAIANVLATIVGKIHISIVKSFQKIQDDRAKAVSALIENMRLVRCYACEGYWNKRIYEIRERQLKQNWFERCLNAAFDLLRAWINLLVPLSIFSYYTIVMNKPLDAATAFTAKIWIGQLNGCAPRAAYMSVRRSLTPSSVAHPSLAG